MIVRCFSAPTGCLRILFAAGVFLLLVATYRITSYSQGLPSGKLKHRGTFEARGHSLSHEDDHGRRKPMERDHASNVRITHFGSLPRNLSHAHRRHRKVSTGIGNDSKKDKPSLFIEGRSPGAIASLRRQKENNLFDDGDEEEDVGGEYGGYATVDDLPPTKVDSVDCTLLFEGSPSEVTKATKEQYDHLVEHPTSREARDFWYKATEDCSAFRAKRGYLMKPVSPEEEEFPIAYSIVIFKDPAQVERLLRAIYRPQNVYCLHIDKKSPVEFMEAISSFAKCFPNVFLSSRSADVHWGYFSVVEPDIICMDEVVKYKKWKYFINLTGQEFPLKTNLDIVKILKTFHGANDISGTRFSKMNRLIKERITHVHKVGYAKTEEKKEPFPHNITMAKGSVHVLASRAFVEYVVNDPVALEFREWCRDTGHASEHFFNSLEYSPQLGVPGAYTGIPKETMTVTRWKEWSWYGYKCQGKFVHSICIIGVGDLPALYDTKFLFVNKLHAGYHPLAYSCLEELHFNRTRDDILGQRQFDVRLYSRLGFVEDRLRVLYANNIDY